MTRYIGRIRPFIFISSPSITTVLEKYTTIPHYTKTIGIPYSTTTMRAYTLPLRGCVSPTALLYSAYALFDQTATAMRSTTVVQRIRGRR